MSASLQRHARERRREEHQHRRWRSRHASRRASPLSAGSPLFGSFTRAGGKVKGALAREKYPDHHTGFTLHPVGHKTASATTFHAEACRLAAASALDDVNLPCLLGRPVRMAAAASDARRVQWQHTRTAHAHASAVVLYSCTVSHAPSWRRAVRSAPGLGTCGARGSQCARYARPQACMARAVQAQRALGLRASCPAPQARAVRRRPLPRHSAPPATVPPHAAATSSTQLGTRSTPVGSPPPPSP